MGRCFPAGQEMVYEGIPERESNFNRPRNMICVNICVYVCFYMSVWCWMVVGPLAGTIKTILIGHSVADLTLYLLGNGESKSCKQAILWTSMHFRKKYTLVSRERIYKQTARSKVLRTTERLLKQIRLEMLRP